MISKCILTYTVPRKLQICYIYFIVIILMHYTMAKVVYELTLEM